MSRSLIFKTFVLLAVTVHVRSQYIDFLQGFSSFLQPYQTTRRSDVTKRPTNRQTNKRTYEGTLFFETDDFIKQKESKTVNPFVTTAKPRRKPKTTKPTTRSPWYQDIPSNDLNNKNKSNNDRTNNVYDTSQINNNNNRRVDNNVYTEYNYDNSAINYNRQTTVRPDYIFGVTEKPINSRPNLNSYTTKNPLLHRPGVRPAPVDVNRPPITNRPVTYTTLRPVTESQDPDEPKIDVGPDEDSMSEADKRRYIEIAEQKCDEYKAMNTKKLVALPLVPSSQGVEVNVSTCKPINIPLIIGGKVVSIQEFPHMSLVGWKNVQTGGYSWKCGGTLLSEQFILTAGHCTYHDKDYNVVSGPPHAVQLGSSYLDGRDSTIVSISSVVRHPKYKLGRSYYDVALIKLVTTITFSERISPACLGVPPPVGNRIIATGWGRTEFGGDSSQELRSVSVPIWDMDECREVWGTSRKLPEGPSPASQLCAGERKGGKDTCQGDSGGPAQIQDGCSWRVIGVTSVGRSCGAAETPALYAKIPRAFIASQVFANVKLNNRNNNGNRGNNDNRNNNANNNGYNINNNANSGNTNGNWGDKVFNSQGVINNQFASTGNKDTNRPGNHQTISNNQFGNVNTDNRETANRPGNHQTIGNNNGVNNNQFGYQNSGNRDEIVNRPGNHQTINREVSSESYYSPNSDTVKRPGNHQTVSYNNNRGTTDSSIYFESGSGENVNRPGNHQTINNHGNRLSDSQNSGNNQGVVYNRPGNHQRIDKQNADTWSNNAQNQQNYKTTTVKYYYSNNNENGNVQDIPTYSNFGVQNSGYGSTETAYNQNNNGYYESNGYNQNDYAVIATKPWWNT